MSTTAHAYLLELGPELSHEDLDLLTYDEPSGQLLVVKGGHVFAYDVSGSSGSGSGGPPGEAGLKWMYPLQEGPPVLALRPSLDNRMLALQRGAALIELVDLASGVCFVHSTHQGRGEILAFFWADAPDTDLVVVTTRAVELNVFAARRQGLRCRERIRHAAAWALYTHETRMVVVGSAAAPRSALSAWQFASHGIVAVPLFELQGLLPPSAAVRQFLPPTGPQAAGAGAGAAPAGAVGTSSGSGALAAGPVAAAAGGRAQGMPHKNLSPECLWLLKMYGRVYLAHADAAASRLELYRFYTDTIILEHVLELFASQVQLAVVDNALLVLHPATSVAVLFDVALGQSRALANPLPLRRLQLLPPSLAAAAAAEYEQQQRGLAAAADGDGGSSSCRSSLSSSSGLLSSEGAGAAAATSGAAALGGSSSQSRTRAGSRRTLIAVPKQQRAALQQPPPSAAAGAVGGDATAAGAAAVDVYESSEVQREPEGGRSSGSSSGSTWVHFMPNVILDVADKTVGRLQLDLQAVADSAEDWPCLVAFLMRRRPLPRGSPLAADPRALLLQVVRSAMQERAGLAVLRATFDRLLQAYTDATQRAAHGVLPGRAAAAGAAAPPFSAAGAMGGQPSLLDVPAVSVITPAELARDVFQWAHDEEVVDALYLQAAVSEFCAASHAAGVAPPPYLQLLCVDLLLQQEQHYQAMQLLYSQPGMASASLATHLLEVARGSSSRGDGGGASSMPAGPGGNGSTGGDAAEQYLRAMLPGQVDASSPSAAVALELALDVLQRQAVPEQLRAAVGATNGGETVAAAPAGSAAASQQQQQPSKVATAALVRQLLSVGQVLQAVRVARGSGGVLGLGVPPPLFLQAAAATGELGTFAAVYRLLQPHVVGVWPDFEAARRAVFDGGR